MTILLVEMQHLFDLRGIVLVFGAISSPLLREAVA